MSSDAPPPYPGADPGGPPRHPQDPAERLERELNPPPDSSDTEFAELLVSLTPRAFVTPFLVVANVAVFVAMIASGVHIMDPKVQDVLDWGANYALLTTDGEWWRLWTSNYLHFGVIHLLFNMAVLWDAGRTVERMVGNGGYFAMYTVSGLIGSLASTAVNGDSVSAGASGAVFGVFGCLGGILVMKKSAVSKGALSRMGRDVAVFIGYNLLFGISAPGIDMAAHVGGLAGGFVCGLILATPLEAASLAGRPKRALMTVAVGVVAIGVGVAAIPRSELAALDEFLRVEEKVVASYNQLITDAQAGKLSDPEAVEILERDVIAPWDEAYAAIRAIDTGELHPEQAKRVALLVEYARLRGEAWHLFADAIRSGDSSKTEEANARQRSAEQTLKTLETMTR